MALRAVGPAVVVVSVLLGALGAVAPQATAAPEITSPPMPAAPIPGMDFYADPVNGWSISYPVGWRVDGSNPALVQIRDPANQALVRVQVVPTDAPLNGVVDQMLATQEQYLKDSGLTWKLLGRQLITLPNGTPAVDVRGELLPGGRSHQLYFIRGGKAFAVNAETTAALWDSFNGDFDRMLQSFSLPR